MVFRTLVFASVSLIVLALVLWMARSIDKHQSVVSTPLKIASATFACDDGKSMAATFFAARTAPSHLSGTAPAPGGSLKLSLSDGRTIEMQQVIAASGARYVDTTGAMVFWNKGKGAFLAEYGQQTYVGCIAAAEDPGGLSEIYTSSQAGFSIRYPVGYTIDPAYRYTGLGPQKQIPGVKFTIARGVAEGTNLARDSYLSVEILDPAATTACTANAFLPEGAPPAAERIESGTTYSVADFTGAGAGNRYEQTVYALSGTSPCVGIRYFIHYSVFENYPAGSVKRFDRQALISRFDTMRRTLVLRR